MRAAQAPPRPSDALEPSDGGAVRHRADARARLATLGLLTVDDAFALPATPRAQSGGRFKALCVLDDAQGRVYVKRWDFDRLEVWLRGALKGNAPVFSGPRELDNLRALAAAGLRVPVALAAGERTRGLGRRSFVAMTALEGEPLDRAAPPITPRARRELIAAVADLARRLHAAGFWHKDLYLGNLILDAQRGLGLIDCERVERAAGGPSPRWRVKDLAALDHSAAWPTCTERLRFVRAYLGVERLDDDARRLARAVRRKARRMGRQGARW